MCDSNQTKETYMLPPGTNGNFAGYPVQDSQTNHPISSYDSQSFMKANKIRTHYDKYWLNFYNHKSQSYCTNTLRMEFAD